MKIKKMNILFLMIILYASSIVYLSSLNSLPEVTKLISPISSAPDQSSLLISSSALSATALSTRNRIQLQGNGNRYLLGVNYPWLNYGHDFGTTAWGHDGISSNKSKDIVDADFAYLSSHGVHVVRWFLFGDGRAAPEFNTEGDAIGFDSHFYPDLDVALSLARKHNIYIIFVLWDFSIANNTKDANSVQLGGRSQIISDPEKRKSLLDNALKPLLERYGRNHSIIAWEVMNEPEGAMDVSGGRWVDNPASIIEMQAFVKETVDYIHNYSSQYATVGSASRGWLSYWRDCNLDFYQYHYYDKMERQYPLDYPYAGLSLDKPCIVGEFPTKNTERSITEYLNTTWKNGYAGSLAWSYQAEDSSSDFRSVANEFSAWSKAHRDDVY